MMLEHQSCTVCSSDPYASTAMRVQPQLVLLSLSTGLLTSCPLSVVLSCCHLGMVLPILLVFLPKTQNSHRPLLAVLKVALIVQHRSYTHHSLGSNDLWQHILGLHNLEFQQLWSKHGCYHQLDHLLPTQNLKALHCNPNLEECWKPLNHGRLRRFLLHNLPY